MLTEKPGNAPKMGGEAAVSLIANKGEFKQDVIAH